MFSDTSKNIATNIRALSYRFRSRPHFRREPTDSFVALCSAGHDKQYALDPRTPLFQKAWNREQIRPPHEKMAAVLGPPFTTKGLASKLDPHDFDANTVDSTTNACIRFQLDFRTRQEDQRKLKKYMKLLELDSMGELAEPQFLIPPYFQANDEQDGWLDVSFQCAQSAVNLVLEVPIRPVIHFTELEFDSELG